MAAPGIGAPRAHAFAAMRPARLTRGAGRRRKTRDQELQILRIWEDATSPQTEVVRTARCLRLPRSRARLTVALGRASRTRTKAARAWTSGRGRPCTPSCVG